MPQDVILRLNYGRIFLGLSHSSKIFSKKMFLAKAKFICPCFLEYSPIGFVEHNTAAHTLVSSFFMQRRHPSGQYWKYSVIGFGLSTHEIFITVIKACQLIHFTSSLAPGSPFYCTQFHLTRLRCFLLGEQEHPLFW